MSSDADVASFMSITLSTAQEAQHFLEMANGDLSRAIELYYQNPSSAQPQPKRPVQPPQRSSGVAKRPSPPPQTSNSAKGLVDDIFSHAQQEQNFDAGDDRVEKIKVTFWKNGFQVDDGDFRSNEDPQNREFLESVSRGMIPRELQKPGVQLDVEIEDNREKDYVPKPKPFNPFGGKAHSIASGKPAAAPPPSASNQAQPPKASKTDFVVQGKPSTKVRIKLQDQLLMLSVNTTATIKDLKNYVLENRPDLRGKKLQLETVFPPQVLSNDAATIEQAGLKMAQINLTVL